MALSTKVGNFAQPTSTNASFAVTGVGFQPKAIILIATNNIANGTGTDKTYYMGMATSTTNRAAISEVVPSGSNVADRAHDNTKCFIVLNSSGTVLVAADLVSLDADGFTLNFSTVDSTARIIGYIALGGADLTNVFIKQFTASAATGNVGYTGVGFKPDAIINMSGGVAGAPPANDLNQYDPMFTLVAGSTAEVVSNSSKGGNESAQLAKYIAKSSATGSLTEVASLVSLDADGFTLNYTSVTSAKVQFSLCLKGGKYAVGVFNQNTTTQGTGNQAITGIGFAPTGLILASINDTTQTSLVTTQSRLSVGFGASSSSRVSIWTGGQNLSTNNSNTDTGKILNMITEGASPTVNSSADLVSFDSNGFTINNTTVDATAREIVYFALGSNAVAAATVANGMMTTNTGFWGT